MALQCSDREDIWQKEVDTSQAAMNYVQIFVIIISASLQMVHCNSAVPL